ncbi:hypothetical protein E8E11_000176 [Didymella keratinophila]|nr:hypothetical protein E8E11_000176 [Didymella keratinophila]
MQRLQALDVPALKQLYVHDYWGVFEFLSGLQAGGIDLETFVFVLTDEDPTQDEEDVLVSLIRSLRNLKTLRLSYMPIKKSACARMDEVFDSFDIDGHHSPIRDAFPQVPPQREPSESVEVFDEDSYVEGYCDFPLSSLVGAPFEYTLQSLSLPRAQHPRWKLRDEDVIIAAEAFPYITDLAISCPDLEEIAFLDGHIGPHLTHQFSNLATMLKRFSHLKYLQLIADSRALTEQSGNVEIQVEQMARKILDILLAQGLQLEFLTVALRDTGYPFDMGPDICHL